DSFGGDVLPDVELGPVADREDAHVLALLDPPVVKAPELGSLVARVPAAERVAVTEDPLLCAGLFLIAPSAAEKGVEAVLGDRVEQGDGLKAVARRVVTRLLFHPSEVARGLDGRDDEPLAELFDAPVAERERFREVVAGVDVDDREREAAGTERLLGEA